MGEIMFHKGLGCILSVLEDNEFEIQ